MLAGICRLGAVRNRESHQISYATWFKQNLQWYVPFNFCLRSAVIMLHSTYETVSLISCTWVCTPWTDTGCNVLATTPICNLPLFSKSASDCAPDGAILAHSSLCPPQHYIQDWCPNLWAGASGWNDAMVGHVIDIHDYKGVNPAKSRGGRASVTPVFLQYLVSSWLIWEGLHGGHLKVAQRPLMHSSCQCTSYIDLSSIPCA